MLKGVRWEEIDFGPEDVCFSLEMGEQIGEREVVLPFLVLGRREKYRRVLQKMEYGVWFFSFFVLK